MAQVRWWSLVLYACAACGRLWFDPVGVSGDGGAQMDGPSGTTPDGLAGPHLNVAFVTSGVFSGNLGGVAGADAACTAAAQAGNRSGTFVAFVSSTGENAIARLAGSRGWMRTDGV